MASLGGYFTSALDRIDQAPIAADGALELALPRLVVGFDQVDAKVLPLRQRQNFRDHFRLIGARRQRAFAHPPGTRPAGFADQDFLARKRHGHALANGIDMGGCVSGADREVFPIRQDVDGDEIDGLIDFPVAQPELPHIGIGDGNGDLRFDRADVGCEVGGRHLAAQQHLVADHDRGDDAGIFPGQAHRRLDLRKILQPVAAEPNPLNDLQPHLGGERWNLIETVLDRIGTHAVGYFGELRHILGDLFRTDLRGRHQRRLVVAERRVGYALQLGVGVDRRARQIDGRGKPPPRRGNRTQGYQEKRQRRTK